MIRELEEASPVACWSHRRRVQQADLFFVFFIVIGGRRGRTLAAGAQLGRSGRTLTTLRTGLGGSGRHAAGASLGRSRRTRTALLATLAALGGSRRHTARSSLGRSAGRPGGRARLTTGLRAAGRAVGTRRALGRSTLRSAGGIGGGRTRTALTALGRTLARLRRTAGGGNRSAAAGSILNSEAAVGAQIALGLGEARTGELGAGELGGAARRENDRNRDNDQRCFRERNQLNFTHFIRPFRPYF